MDLDQQIPAEPLIRQADEVGVRLEPLLQPVLKLRAVERSQLIRGMVILGVCGRGALLIERMAVLKLSGKLTLLPFIELNLDHLERVVLGVVTRSDSDDRTGAVAESGEDDALPHLITLLRAIGGPFRQSALNERFLLPGTVSHQRLAQLLCRARQLVLDEQGAKILKILRCDRVASPVGRILSLPLNQLAVSSMKFANTPTRIIPSSGHLTNVAT